MQKQRVLNTVQVTRRQGTGGEKIRNDKIDEKAAISIIPVLLVTLALSITQERHGRSSIMA